MGIENRQHRRVFVGADFRVSFVLEGESYAGIGVANLSEGGCLALVPGERSKPFHTGVDLEELTLHHELMPHQPVAARVAYTFGAGELDLVGVGIQFLSMKPGMRRSIRDFVEAIPEDL